jgi:4-nitrophenyl phosphatase
MLEHHELCHARAGELVLREMLIAQPESSDRAKSDIDQARALLDAKEGILLDWDGCVALNDLPHAAGLRFIATFLDQIAIVSNSSTLRPSDVSRTLAQAGISFPVERVILAGHQALLRAGQVNKPTLVFGSLQMRALARELGVQQVKQHPEVIVLLRDTRFNYARLTQGVNALAEGAYLIVANPDLTHPGGQGILVPETGALLAALLACVAVDQARVEVIGKPNAQLFQRACVALGVEPSQAVMIGDNPDTDILGANKLDMGSILVSPGSSLLLTDLF